MQVRPKILTGTFTKCRDFRPALFELTVFDGIYCCFSTRRQHESRQWPAHENRSRPRDVYQSIYPAQVARQRRTIDTAQRYQSIDQAAAEIEHFAFARRRLG